MSHSVDEHYAFYREVLRTARKQHDCCACEIPIEPGQRYTVVSTGWEGRIEEWKRCARCQFLHEQLRQVCSAVGDWPDEDLNCGHTFEERWERKPPEWLAALAFWSPGEPLPQVQPCSKSLAYDYDRAIVYRVPYCGQSGGACRPRETWRGIEGTRGHDNEAHRRPCTEAAP